MAADYEILANAHMAAQVAQAATVQAALTSIWEETLDPSDIVGSFRVFVERARPYIGAGRTLSERTAAAYLDAVGAVSGVGPLEWVGSELLDPDVLTRSLYGSTGKALGRAIVAVRDGGDPSAALSIASGNMLGASKRHMLNASRRSLIRASVYNKDLIGWSRVSDGAPCAFCAMLVSRGPAYNSDITARFRAHDRCGCSVRPIPKNDPTRGWSPQARLFRELWNAQYNGGRDFGAAIADLRGPHALAA
jgi:hypothetical protein